MFAGLALGELAGAAALAARQHRPGATGISPQLVIEYRLGGDRSRVRPRRLRVAESRSDAATQALAVHQERKAGCARLALASGWARAVRHSRNGDPLLDRVEISRVSITGP